MTTLAELKKYVKTEGFVDKMKVLGFELGPDGLWFYRLRDGYVDYIGFSLKSTKRTVTVPVTSIKPELLDQYDMSQFPKGFTSVMPFYSSTYINRKKVSIGGDRWKVEVQSDIDATFEKLYTLIETDAEPWLKNIDTDEKLYESWTVNFKESDNAKRLKKVLLG